jgi:hypothetical protein
MELEDSFNNLSLNDQKDPYDPYNPNHLSYSSYIIANDVAYIKDVKTTSTNTNEDNNNNGINKICSAFQSSLNLGPKGISAKVRESIQNEVLEGTPKGTQEEPIIHLGHNQNPYCEKAKYYYGIICDIFKGKCNYNFDILRHLNAFFQEYLEVVEYNLGNYYESDEVIRKTLTYDIKTRAANVSYTYNNIVRSGDYNNEYEMQFLEQALALLNIIILYETSL